MKNKNTTATWGQTTNGSYCYECKRNAQECLHSCLVHSRASKTSDFTLMVWIPRLAAALRFIPRSSRKMDSEGCRPSRSKHSLYILGSGLQTPSRQDSTTWGRDRKERETSPKVVLPCAHWCIFFKRRAGGGQLRFVNNKWRKSIMIEMMLLFLSWVIWKYWVTTCGQTQKTEVLVQIRWPCTNSEATVGLFHHQ